MYDAIQSSYVLPEFLPDSYSIISNRTTCEYSMNNQQQRTTKIATIITMTITAKKNIFRASKPLSYTIIID